MHHCDALFLYGAPGGIRTPVGQRPARLQRALVDHLSTDAKTTYNKQPTTNNKEKQKIIP